ncbi:diablo IAP-binding mitochondrial protein-like [Anoplopoma fimbria]|uniref:diablo IAP-binding mitochondrial protein-like n=1 Tax=Anoplopoma fimbria TaxID=229290 RepID=UPI0023ED52AC|nr:diablo IAP-binding mitochondrial protein-like [Anoplopoma fimbria]
MQAVGQCSACASRAAGGLLRNQRDLSLLRTNKNVLRRGAACIRFISHSESALFSRKPGVQKLGERTDTEHISKAPLGVGRGLYSTPFTQRMENLSHDSLIRRAASLVTDSSSTFLSQTSLALTNALTDYSKAVHTRIVVQRRYLASLGKLNQAEKDSFLDVINSQRAEASDRLHECKRVESTWINAVNLCKMAAEAAHTSGAEQASITVRTNIQVAQSQVGEAQKMSADADKKLAETKVEEIQRMAEYAAFLDDSEEHEVHEAYLRED